MRRTLLPLWFILSFTQGSVLNGEIESLLSIDTDERVWARSTLWLNMEKTTSLVHCYGRMRVYTDEKMKFHLQPKETYIDHYGKWFDLRAGLQQILWGTAYELNPTSVVNPYDLSQRTLYLPEERLGVISFKIDYYPLSWLSLTGVYIPYFLPALRQVILPDTIIEIPLPPRTLKNSEFAFKLGLQSILGCDISLSYFRGMDDFPSLQGYQKIKVYGGDFITSISGFTLWAEGAYKTPDSTLDIATGGEYTFDNNLYLMTQFYHGSVMDFRGNFLMGLARYPVLENDTLELGLGYEPKDRTYIVFPQGILSLADALSIKLGGVWIRRKSKEGILSQLKSAVILELRYSF